MKQALQATDSMLVGFTVVYGAIRGLIAGTAAWLVLALLGSDSVAWLSLTCALGAASVSVFKVIRMVRDEYRAFARAAFDAAVEASTAVIPTWRDNHCHETLEYVIHNGIRERVTEVLAPQRLQVLDLGVELPPARKAPHE